jgi:hypothetical protein
LAGNGKLRQELGWRSLSMPSSKAALLRDWGGSARGTATIVTN